MPFKHPQYECIFCHSVYENENDANNCEKMHLIYAFNHIDPIRVYNTIEGHGDDPCFYCEQNCSFDEEKQCNLMELKCEKFKPKAKDLVEEHIILRGNFIDFKD